METFIQSARIGNLENATNTLCNEWNTSRSWINSCFALVYAVAIYLYDHAWVPDSVLLYVLENIYSNLSFCDYYTSALNSTDFDFCVENNVIPFGLCYSLYPNVSSSNFLGCYDLLLYSPFLNTSDVNNI